MTVKQIYDPKLVAITSVFATVKKSLLLTLFAVCFFNGMSADAQNINVPNKTGPMGLEVNTNTGNVYCNRTDMVIKARLNIEITFSYNSDHALLNTGYGNGWFFNYGMMYSVDTAGTVTITMGDGREDDYKKKGSEYVPPKGIFDKLIQYQPGKYELVTKYGLQYFFDTPSHRRLTKIQEPNGNFISLNYNDSLLTQISNGSGQFVTINYDKGLLSSITDNMISPALTYSYFYDSYKNLVRVSDPAGKGYEYGYLINGPLSQVKDKNLNVADIIYYPDFAAREIITCNSRQSFSYERNTRKTTVIDFVPTSENQITTYTYANEGWLTNVQGGCCGYNASFTYDANGNSISRKDANGNLYYYSYDNNGNLLSARDPLNKTVFFTYSSDFNQITSYTDRNGNTTSISYDSKGNPVKVTEPGNIQGTATYNSAGDMVSATDGAGNIYSFEYNSYGFPVRINGPLGFMNTIETDIRGKTLSISDGNNNTSKIQYDILSRPVIITDALNKTLLIGYDSESNIKKLADENGNAVTYFYDASNRLIQASDALGHSFMFSYDAMNNLTEYRDRNGNISRFYFDNLNRLVKTTNALGESHQFGYDANGNNTTLALPNGNVIKCEYDQLDRPVSITDNYGLISKAVYDNNDNILSYTNALGGNVSFTYDALDRQTKMTDPLGNSMVSSYDNNGNFKSLTDRNNKTKQYNYDALNRLVSYVNTAGGTSRFTYDGNNNLLSFSDENNNSTNYAYDVLNRLVKQTYADGTFLQMSYDNAGNLTGKRLTDGSQINYSYDALNRMINKTLPGNDVYTYGYNNEGSVTNAINSNASIALTYDAIERVSSETFNSHVTAFTYNTATGTEKITYPSGSGVYRKYDLRNRLISVQNDGSMLASYQYNGNDLLQQASIGNGITTHMEYDVNARLNDLSTTPSFVQQFKIEYDNEANKTLVSRANVVQGSEIFSYDNKYRLTGFKQGALNGNSIPAPLIQNNYSYDAAGNRVSANLNGINTNYISNNLNQYTNNRTYDGNGNLTFDGSFYKKYDAEGKKISDSSGSAVLKYQYDALGRKIRRVTGGNTINLYFSGMEEIEQRNASDVLLEKTFFKTLVSPITKFINNKNYYYHQNDLNSVDAITDSAGQLVERYQYDVFGKPVVLDAGNKIISSSLIKNQFLFTGQKYDTTVKTYSFHFRDYSPLTGTFDQRDPLGYVSNGSLYHYVENNPANLIDPYGLKPSDQVDWVAYGKYYQQAQDKTRKDLSEGWNSTAPEIYHTSKNTKDFFSLLSGFDKYNVNKYVNVYNNTLLERFKSTLGKINLDKAGVLKLNQFLSNPITQKFVIGLKILALPEKFYKIYKEWHCGKLKTTINITEASLSTASLLYGLGKLNGWRFFKSSPAWLAYYAVFEVASKVTTGKSIITNIVDLPWNIFEIVRGSPYALHDAFTNFSVDPNTDSPSGQYFLMMQASGAVK